MTTTRTESDSFGPLEVPSEKYFGAQSARSLINFSYWRRDHAGADDPRPWRRETVGRTRQPCTGQYGSENRRCDC